MSTELPLVSVIIPTLNAERHLAECLDALLDQDWPRDRLELLLIDADSTDLTVEIASSRGVDRVLPNPRKTGEAGKAEGIRAARGDLICSVDSDNIVIGRDWLRRMVRPFLEDEEVIAAEARRFHYRRDVGMINRWHALAGVADPLTLYVGNYCRDSFITGTWTGYPHGEQVRDGWTRVKLEADAVPVLGANGFVIRRAAFDLLPVGDYYFDLDYVHDLVGLGRDVVARVDAEILHYFCDDVGGYARKTRRRADDFFFFKSEGQRTYPWTRRQQRAVIQFTLETVLVLPVALRAARGAMRQPDTAWAFHVPACLITLVVYGVGAVRWRIAPKMLDRRGWRQ